VVVEYDGPSLSDTSSILESRLGLGEGSGYTESSLGDDVSLDTGSQATDPDDRSTGVGEGSMGSRDTNSRSGHSYSNEQHLEEPIQIQDFGQDSPESSTVSGFPEQPAIQHHLHPLTGPKSEAAPSLLTESELGSRWLREQNNLAIRRIGSTSRSRPVPRRHSSLDNSGSEEESLGDLALFKDARGSKSSLCVQLIASEYYYSYQTSEVSSPSAGRQDHSVQWSDGKRFSGYAHVGLRPQEAIRNDKDADFATSGHPTLAPDCSACGLRLDYMRFVCLMCGEGQMWKEDRPGKSRPSPRIPEDAASTISDSSSITEWAEGADTTTSILHTARPRSDSDSTNASDRPVVRSIMPERDMTANSGQHRYRASRGYELCPGCVAIHGIAHIKAAARSTRASYSARESRSRHRLEESRHVFRERIWGPKGWVDLG
jgi:hypothetical protein